MGEWWHERAGSSDSMLTAVAGREARLAAVESMRMQWQQPHDADSQLSDQQ